MENTKNQVLVVKKDIDGEAWNNSLPVPLVGGAKALAIADQSGVVDTENYIKVKHGPGFKHLSVLAKKHFLTLKGEEFASCKE